MAVFNTTRIAQPMNALLNTLSPFAAHASQPAAQPDSAAWFPVEITETDSAITFEVHRDSLTGVQTHVYMHRGELSIEIIQQDAADQTHIVHYCREFQLPKSVRHASADVSLNDKSLYVRLPKKRTSRR